VSIPVTAGTCKALLLAGQQASHASVVAAGRQLRYASGHYRTAALGHTALRVFLIEATLVQASNLGTAARATTLTPHRL
jgi:hypothetical protein